MRSQAALASSGQEKKQAGRKDGGTERELHNEQERGWEGEKKKKKKSYKKVREREVER